MYVDAVAMYAVAMALVSVLKVGLSSSRCTDPRRAMTASGELIPAIQTQSG